MTQDPVLIFMLCVMAALIIYAVVLSFKKLPRPLLPMGENDRTWPRYAYTPDRLSLPGAHTVYEQLEPMGDWRVKYASFHGQPVDLSGLPFMLLSAGPGDSADPLVEYAPGEWPPAVVVPEEFARAAAELHSDEPADLPKKEPEVSKIYRYHSGEEPQVGDVVRFYWTTIHGTRLKVVAISDCNVDLEWPSGMRTLVLIDSLKLIHRKEPTDAGT